MYIQSTSPCSSSCSPGEVAARSLIRFPHKAYSRNVAGRTKRAYHNGLGDGINDAASIAQSGAAVTSGIITALTAAGTAGLATGIGAAVAGAAMLAIAIYNEFKGCGQTCTITSDIANRVEPLLKQNLAAYLAAPVHYASLQAAYLNNFQTAWASLVAACSNPTYLQAGQNCIGDRQQGACHYQTSPGGWSNGVYTPPGQQGSGSACWNWWIGYYDPIANDPTVVPDPSPLSTVGADLSSFIPPTIAGVPSMDLLIPLGALLLLWAVL